MTAIRMCPRIDRQALTNTRHDSKSTPNPAALQWSGIQQRQNHSAQDGTVLLRNALSGSAVGSPNASSHRTNRHINRRRRDYVPSPASRHSEQAHQNHRHVTIPLAPESGLYATAIGRIPFNLNAAAIEECVAECVATPPKTAPNSGPDDSEMDAMSNLFENHSESAPPSSLPNIWYSSALGVPGCESSSVQFLAANLCQFNISITQCGQFGVHPDIFTNLILDDQRVSVPASPHSEAAHTAGLEQPDAVGCPGDLLATPVAYWVEFIKEREKSDEDGLYRAGSVLLKLFAAAAPWIRKEVTLHHSHEVTQYSLVDNEFPI
ncbi:hypothetical protein B0H14DRAFT_3131209 [Mycena olivaceomarginata]|nr:hypothetical protein B0H14DRAFT_3131209 [Mycena olivaceomarginata]